MDNSAQNLLKEAADRLVQTAEHLGRVAAMSRLSTTPAGTSLSATSSVVTSCTTTSRPANSAPPIASSAAAEHAALFGYRPPTAGNVRSRGNSTRGRAGGRGRSSSGAPYHLYQRGHSWSRSFVCLAYSNQTHPPTPSERVDLALNNLGEKRIEFPREGNGTQVHEAIINTFPSLTSGYQLLRNSDGRGKELMKIPMQSTGYSVDYLKSVLGQAKGFLRPLQNDIVLVESSASNSERNEVRK